MKEGSVRLKSPGKRRSALLSGFMILAVIIGVPFLVLVYQSHHTGLSIGQMVEHIFKGARRTEKAADIVQTVRGKRIDFLTPAPTGSPPSEPPRIGSLVIVDLDKDGLPDILVADMLANRIGWIRQYPAGVYTQKWISPLLAAPAHVNAIDIDGDGDLDLLVACMGQLFPSNDKIGSVVILENDGKMNFAEHDMAHSPTHLISLETSDMNKDGKPDFVSVRMNVYPPFTRDGTVTLWLNHWGQGRP